MSSGITRITKSRSMMLSLYTLSGVAGLLLLVFFLLSLIHIVHQFDWSGPRLVWQNWFDSFALILVAVVGSVPFAAAFTYLLVSRSGTRGAPFLFSVMKLAGHAPTLLFGLIFLFLVGPTRVGLILAIGLLSMAHIVRRWTELSSRVRQVEIEAMQALGMQIWQIIYFLYVRRFFSQYLFHTLAVFCSLFVLVTPFLCFAYFAEETPFLLSIELYRSLDKDLGKTSGLALMVLVIHGIRVWLDHQTSYWEVEYG